MLTFAHNLGTLFETPRLFFTLKGNPRSEEVVSCLRVMVQGTAECVVFESPEEIRARFESGISPNGAVVLFDHNMGINHFSPTTHSRPDDSKLIPSWAWGAQWAVKVAPRCQPAERCARQLYADFRKRFQERLNNGLFPWGRPRKGEPPPINIKLPEEVNFILERLNQGPNLAAAIADKAHLMELPKGSKISWFRIAAEPIRCDGKKLKEILHSFHLFERACDKLVRTAAEVRELLFAGVDVEPALQESYLFPSQDHFSVGRLDLHYTPEGVFASENDEMPGGFAEVVHLDRAYGVNKERWEWCFRWLTSAGPLLILVSHDWSKVYIPELRWLTDYLRELGYRVHFMTTDKMDELSCRSGGVYLNGEKLGTIWRQFPIFETKGLLVEVVKAAQQGEVRLVPEFAHFGNKAWYSIFRSHIQFFKRELAALKPGAFELLDKIMPDSNLIHFKDKEVRGFPCTVAAYRIDSLDHLRTLPESVRNGLVLKVSGANTMAARSYGVMMGHGLSQETWSRWIDERVKRKQPFIVQRRLETGVARIPVLNTNRACPELFAARVLLRPWSVGGELISASACAVPSNTLRVHGRVDMAMAPVVFE